MGQSRSHYPTTKHCHRPHENDRIILSEVSEVRCTGQLHSYADLVDDPVVSICECPGFGEVSVISMDIQVMIVSSLRQRLFWHKLAKGGKEMRITVA